jgi:hypothetical protein
MIRNVIVARLSVLGLFLGALVTGAGCSSSGKVEGTVKYKGQPVEGAMVVVVKDDGSPVAQGTTDASGKFKLTTPQGKDAVPSGTYYVTVSKIAGGDAPVVNMAEGAPKEAITKMSGASKTVAKTELPAVFATKNTTTLKITIPSGDYTLDLGN